MGTWLCSETSTGVCPDAILSLMLQIYTWLKAGIRTFSLLSEYGKAIAKQWMSILFGETLIGTIFLIWWAISNPKNPPLILTFVVAMFVAGYFVWRADHVRLIPKFEITEVLAQVTETDDPNTPSLYVQMIPRCLTEAPVYECRGHLLRVSKRLTPEDEWKLTDMNAPLFLGWDYYGTRPFTLEPGIDRRMNVCSWNSADRFIIPAVDPLPLKYKSVFNDVCTFKFDIKVTAKDCPSVNVSVTVAIAPREWNKPVVELIQAGH